MAAPIGKKLRDARLARGLTLEDVHHHTRISKTLLAAMENDDLGAFANQTYARKFFVAYGRHLEVDVTGLVQHFRPGGLGGVVEHHPYLQPSVDRTGPRRRGAPPRRRDSPSIVLFAGLAALAMAATVAVWAGLRERQAGTPAGTLTIHSAPGPAPALPSSTPRTRPPAPPATTVATAPPPVVPVLRATPVDEASATPGGQAAPTVGVLPLIESPRPPATTGGPR
jgi:hypothetical protein